MRYILMPFVIVILLSAEATPVPNLKEKLDAIDWLLHHFRNELEIPGFSVGIVADGKTVFAEGYGLRNLSDPNSYVTNRTLFAIASCTKAFTTYALDCLVNRDGVLNWSDRVVDHIPEFRMKSEHTTNNIKVKDLITHTSGLPRHDMSWLYANFSINEWLKRIPHLEPTYDLREKYQYSNIMFAVAGLVIERVTGQSWEKMVQDRIFKPLHMTRSYTSLHDLYHRQVDDDIAIPYSSAKFPDKPSVSPAWHMDISAVGPAGSIISSAEDMTKWIEEQLRLTGPSKEMHIPQMSINNDPAEGAGFAYGLGWELAFPNGRFSVAHSGHIDGLTARVVLHPKEKMGIVLLVNSDAYLMYNFNHDLVSRITDIMTSTVSTGEAESREWVASEKVKILKNADRSSSTWEFKSNDRNDVHQPEQYVGTFENGGYESVKVFTENPGLFASFNGIRFVLKSKGRSDIFDAISPFPRELVLTFYFVRDFTGDVSGVRINMEPALPPILFEKRVNNELYAQKYLASFVGSFQSVTSLVKVYLNQKKGLSIACDTSEYSGNLKPLKLNWFSWEFSASEFIAADTSRPLFEFNVTTDGVVKGLNKHSEGFVEIFSKI